MVQGSLDVRKYLFGMLFDELVSGMVLGMGEPCQEPFSAVLRAWTLRVSKHVSRSIGVEELLHIGS
jgi:hypothetical protein